MDVILISCGLAGLGYFLNKNEKQNRYSEKDVYKHLKPSSNNRIKENKRKLKKSLDAEYSAAYNPKNSSDVYFSELTGLPIGMKNWSKNTRPFIGSKDILNPLQYNNNTLNINKLENFTGSSFVGNNPNILAPLGKKERPPLFENFTEDIYKIQPATDKNRFSTSNFRQNELPITQMKVAPGLNLGFTTEGSG